MAELAHQEERPGNQTVSDTFADAMTKPPNRLPFLTGNSQMIARVRDFDWSANPLGEPQDWQPELIATASFVLESQIPMALVWGDDLVTIYNDAFEPILGDKPAPLGRSFAVIWAEAWDEIKPIAERAFSGESTFIEDFPLIIDRHGSPEQAYFTFCYSPVRAADGTVVGLLDTVMETTAAVLARRRGALLTNELGHRLKNTMSMVQAIAQQSLRGVDRELVHTFNERIIALGRAHDVLQRESWERAQMASLVEAVLSLHGGGGRFTGGGPDLSLGPKAVLSISLLLHELSVNAAKYGALSVPDGQVELSWHLEGEGRAAEMVLDWRERGGPPAAEPERRGFGSRLIDLGLMGTGNVTKHYLVSGFATQFRASLPDVLQS